jgi:hypothetical protein
MDSQTLNIFTQFVDFIKNIDNYGPVVDQIKAATTANTDSLNKLTQGKTLSDFESSLNDTEQRLILERAEFDKTYRAQNDVLVQRAQDLNSQEAIVSNQKQLTENYKAMLDLKYDELAARSIDLNKKEQDLIAREADNNAVAQDLAARLALIRQAGG